MKKTELMPEPPGSMDLSVEQAFLATLTEKQKRLCKLRFKMGLTVPECAKRVGANKRNVDKMIRLIREKAEKFF